jgi:ribosomal-protein-alanine N-acetyltransferase
MKITLETERLLLRPYVISDAEIMFSSWASLEIVSRYMTWNPHKSVDETRSLIEYWIKEYDKEERINFAITLKSSGELIGGIDVVGYLEDKTPVIGYNLAPKYWNNGYTTEACKAVIELLFSKGFTKIRIDADVRNIASNRVIVKCGGIYLDTVEDARPMKGDTVMVNRYIVSK